MAEMQFFPSYPQEALAMLYVQNQDLSGKNPEDLAVMYYDAYERICGKAKEVKKEKTAAKRESRNLSML